MSLKNVIAYVHVRHRIMGIACTAVMLCVYLGISACAGVCVRLWCCASARLINLTKSTKNVLKLMHIVCALRALVSVPFLLLHETTAGLLGIGRILLRCAEFEEGRVPAGWCEVNSVG